MITKNEISSLNLSPTKKDFVQIWNELIEVASKITERWDPTSTNESDPGIVLLKVLTGIADKLNYNIDKNILEAYMPTAAQMESMQKLCELVGYDIKYYQSAETRVRISYTGNTTDTSEENSEKLPRHGLRIPKFTTITNADKDITFVTTNTVPMLITNSTPWVEVPCIEGQISQCESMNENNLITLSQLGSNNRYYLPEIQIAENGIFVYDAAIDTTTGMPIDGTAWTQVSNLNTQPSDTRVFKFGYDSFEGRPYIAFPDDVGSLIGDGLFIYFIRTSGLSGNISPRTLGVLELPTDKDWEGYSTEQFEVVNVDATTNGANIESISNAYRNFKKTVGTFDTLVTCRDYMNKIYSLMDANNSPYVSNILVTDIRNDINKAITLCSCNEFGILYKETPLTRFVEGTSITRKANQIGNSNVYQLVVNQNDIGTDVPVIDHFDLLLYPFKTFTQVSFGTNDLVAPYNKSFAYTEQMNREIEASLAEFKTCAHKLTTPAEGDIVAINNYLRLNALIATSSRVSEIEANDILKNIKVALVNEFNLRNLDFGEEIPFDSILSVIENADSRIKVVSLQEPVVLTTYSVKEEETIEGNSITGTTSKVTSKEYGIASAVEGSDDKIQGVYYTDKDGNDYKTKKGETAKDIYNKLVLRNILAGRASLFDYDETFVPNNSEKPYTITKDITNILNDITAEVYDKDTAAAIKTAVNAKMSNSETAVGEYLLYGSGNDLIKNGFYSSDSILTLRVFTEDITDRVLTDGGDIASALNAEIASKTTPGEYTLDVTGFDGGEVTIVVSKLDADSDIVVKLHEKKYEVYETYEHNFIKNNSSQARDVTLFARNRNSSNQNSSGLISDIKRVEALCEIHSSTPKFENVKLDKNEVIKFRVPNLITTKTFPAYVYYRFEKGSGATSHGSTTAIESTNGSYAEAISLTSFIMNQSVERFFPELWSLAGDNIRTFTSTFDSNGAVSLPQQTEITKIFNTAIVVGTNDNTKFFAESGKLQEYLDTLKATAAPGTKITFKYYPLNRGTMPTWSACIRKFDTNLPNDGITLRRLSSTSNYPKGRLVIETGQRLFEQSSEYLENSRVGDVTYVCKSLGADPAFSTVSAGSDIELQSGDKLYIHYTPSSTNEDGETVNAEEVSVVYEGGDVDNPIILKPSGFTLMPSDDVKASQNISWKKENVEFTGYGKKNLLALAPNEQIELRSISRVVLNTTAKFYKNFNHTGLEKGTISEYELKDGEYIFYTDQNTQEAAYYGSGSVITLEGGAYIPRAAETIEVSQILEQGLHIIPWSSVILLNNTRKITITEYQYVTLVEGDVLNTLTVESAETADGYTISNTQWTKCVSTDENPIIYTTAGSETPELLPKIALTSGPSTSWEVCSFLELSTSPGYSQPLRAAAVSPELGSGSGSGSGSGADLSLPTVSITDKILIYPNTGTSVGEPIEIAPQQTVIPASGGKETFETVSIKLDTIAQVASGSFEKANNDSESASEDIVADSNIQMKIFKEDPPSLIALSDVNEIITPISNKQSDSTSVDSSSAKLNNYWTKIDVGSTLLSINELEVEPKPNALKLNFMIPEEKDMFGIFSIYLEVPDHVSTTKKHNIPAENFRTFIDVPSEFGPYNEVISIFNYKGAVAGVEHSWWTEGLDAHLPNRLYLKAGLNCIKITKSCSLLIKAENSAIGNIIYDNLRLVKGRNTHGINLKLLDFQDTSVDQAQTESDLADEILNNIAALDKQHEFYYNVPIENSLAIEFDTNINSFSNPYTLYDINNVNNSFVVSKLDVKYLDTGLKIAKSSRY